VDGSADVIEFVRVERDRDGFDAMAEDHRRNAAGFSQCGYALADFGAAGGVEYCYG
jgi:hypothetical protein